MSFSFGHQKQKSTSNQKQEPWAPTIPYLQDYLGQIGDMGGTIGASAGQTDAYNQLSSLYGAGNPYTSQIEGLANETAQGVPSQSGMIADAYTGYKEALTPYASGEYLDPESNPHMRGMLDQVRDDAFNRVNAMWQGAGRDPSGNALGVQSISRGITQAELPLLFNQFNQQQSNQLNAINGLMQGGVTAAQGMQGLDQAALAARGAALPMYDAALASQSWGPENQFNLEQIFKDLPEMDLATMGGLLLPVAQLGQQQTGSGTSKGTSFGFGAKLLSDERFKEDIKEIGYLADGTPIISFRYKGEDTVRIGVRAQDVEEGNPDAITEMDMGNGATVKYVDLGEATKRSAEMMPQPVPPTARAPGSGTSAQMHTGQGLLPLLMAEAAKSMPQPPQGGPGGAGPGMPPRPPMPGMPPVGGPPMPPPGAMPPNPMAGAMLNPAMGMRYAA